MIVEISALYRHLCSHDLSEDYPNQYLLINTQNYHPKHLEELVSELPGRFTTKHPFTAGGRGESREGIQKRP